MPRPKPIDVLYLAIEYRRLFADAPPSEREFGPIREARARLFEAIDLLDPAHANAASGARIRRCRGINPQSGPFPK